MRRSTDCAPTSDHSDDAGVSHALPGQTQHQCVELGGFQLPLGFPRRRPDELALVQAPSGQPDADAVVHQHFDAVGTFVGEQVRMMGVSSAEDGDHTGQRRVGACAHVQRGGGQPGGVDADHLRRAAVQLARSAAALRGQVTVMDTAPLRNSTLISCSVCTGVTGGNARAMNAGAGDEASVRAATQGLGS